MIICLDLFHLTAYLTILCLKPHLFRYALRYLDFLSRGLVMLALFNIKFVITVLRAFRDLLLLLFALFLALTESTTTSRIFINTEGSGMYIG